LAFLPALWHQAGLGLAWRGSRAIALLLGSGLLVRIVTLSADNQQLKRWGHFACLSLSGVLVFVTYPSARSGSEPFLNQLLICLLIAASFFPLRRWFVAAAALFGTCYSLALRYHPGPESQNLWLELAVVGVISAIIQRTQAGISEHYNQVTLTDEVRLKLYSQTAEDARKAQRRYERFTNGGKEGLIFHSGGKVLDANIAALEMLGSERKRIEGQSISRFLSKPSARLLTQPTDRKNTAFTRVKIIREDGTPVEALAFNHELLFPEGRVAVLGLRAIDPKAAAESRSSVLGDEMFRN